MSSGLSRERALEVARSSGRLLRPLLERPCEKRPLVPGVARMAPERLVFGVAGAERVSVQEHDPIAGDLDDEGLVDEPAAGAPGECVAEQEVVVAADHVDGNAGRDSPGERGLDTRMGGAAVVVAEPLIEEIAKDVEPVRPPHGAGEKRRERLHRAGAVGGEVHVAREQKHHARAGGGTGGTGEVRAKAGKTGVAMSMVVRMMRDASQRFVEWPSPSCGRRGSGFR